MARVVVANRKAGGNRLKLADYIEAMIRDQITKDYDEVTPSKKKPRGES
jgi:hypothetical protein